MGDVIKTVVAIVIGIVVLRFVIGVLGWMLGSLAGVAILAALGFVAYKGYQAVTGKGGHRSLGR